MSRMEDEQLIERYILNQMSEDEATEFEAFFLSNQECIDQLETAEKLYQGLGMIANSAEITLEVNKAKSTSNDHRWWQVNVPIWSLAALLMITLTPSVLINNQTQKPIVQLGEVSMIDLPLAKVRSGAESNPTVIKKNSGTVLSFYIDQSVEDLVFPNYRFQIQSSGNIIYELSPEGLRPDQNDMLYVSLGRSYLKEGTYDVSLDGMSGDKKSQQIYVGKIIVE